MQLVFLTAECSLPTDNVLDPTFLLDAQEWEQIMDKQAIFKGKYILYYGFDTSDFCAEAIRLLKKKLGLPVVGISVSLHSPYSFDCFYQQAGPREFLNLIKNATLILTSSFHGMALSINFRKDFIVLKHGTRMSRMESLLANFNLKNRLVHNIDTLDDLVNYNIHVNYSDCENTISEKVDYSRKWLVKHILNQLDE